jgi:ATP-dependent DNA ligase
VRKATLVSVLAKAGPGLRLNEHMECDDGEIVFRDAGKMGLEGIVSKPKDSATVPADHPAGRQHTASSSSS